MSIAGVYHSSSRRSSEEFHADNDPIHLPGPLRELRIWESLPITKVTVGQDKRSVRLYVKGLQEGHIHDLKTPGVRSIDGESVLHPQAYSTLNYIPKE